MNTGLDFSDVDPLDHQQAQLIRETLADHEAVAELFYMAFDDKYPVDALDKRAKQGYSDVRELAFGSFVAELEMIDAASESPIERMFCTSVLLTGRINFWNLLRWTPSPESIVEYQQRMRDCIEASGRWKQEMEKHNLKRDELIHRLLDRGEIEEQEDGDVDFFIFMYHVMDYKYAFHITQQAQLPSSVAVSGHRVRPDLYVWLPLDESFNLILECDGYAYHRDKRTFTGDRKRDRILKSLGYEVLRFSGPEIYEDPPRVAWELLMQMRLMQSRNAENQRSS